MKLKKSFSDYQNWFNDYTKNYFDNENGITKDYMQLKIDHTKNVIDVMIQICDSINLNEDEKEIAKVIALFHDVGRFFQIHKYKIDDDHLTENHALLSISELNDNKVLDDEDKELKDLILKAIMYHNIVRIPEDEKDDTVILFSKLIRDADKVDIYRVMIEDVYSKPEEDLKILYKQYSFEPKVSDIIYRNIMNGVEVERKDVKTMLDHIMLQLAWAINDINFKKSQELIRNNNYIETIFKIAKSDDRGNEIYNKIIRELNEV